MSNQARHDALAKRNFFDEMIALRDDQRRRGATAEVLIAGEDIPWELNPNGNTRWYVAPTMDDVAAAGLLVQTIKVAPGSRTGRQQHPGNVVIYVWRGTAGHSVIDDERHDWEQGDVIQIPLRASGSVVQHFNDGDDDVELLFCGSNTSHNLTIDRGSQFEQLEPCPEYAEAHP
jgi:quercetin dioxygenase-like cupin family protein